MKYLVECLSCHRTEWVELVSYGKGYIGQCPECENLAYNRAELPVEPETRLLSRVRAARYIH